ncbi:penicillin-binding protein 1C [Cesiribacter andamanensis]|uniref:peptidoglycan glycosyltransferase n=1 Tax=Cesiribacter andamanensis AMV16 TaxID=1279009 RepID=M7NQ89_9BACT|nr:penicillin-binding protein 1C [Cesiribacter andamanensis]EMR03885.1 Penicillin-binding protein 4 precursor [Cesiribacter andamanensis AMV16]
MPLTLYPWTKRFRWKYLLGIALLGGGLFFATPLSLFRVPYATVITDAEGSLLGAQIAPDGQWRFPAAAAVPDKFERALLTFEDRHFYQHPGFNPLAMAKALRDNLRAGKVVRGGSTISMQVIRLVRQGQPRTLGEKLLELLLAIKLELHYSKAEILQLYATHAPFGGNTVGLQTACWRYYQRPAEALSWAEAATLAVLPNAPALIFPGKNQQLLLQKRNRLLGSLLEQGALDSTTYQLALAEPLPGTPHPFPASARHLLLRLLKEGRQGRLTQTTLQAPLQEQLVALADRHQYRLSGNQVHNAALLVLETGTGNVLAYVGNTSTGTDLERGAEVDVIAAPRSTGSILKPFLYAAALHEGSLLPGMLLPDVPFYQRGFNPQNFNKSFEGAVPANRALARSLNIPYVYLLQEYGVERFHHLLKQAGMTTLKQGPGHYGLALILGGAEGTLWDITGMYASMGRSLQHFEGYRQQYDPADYHPPTYLQQAQVPPQLQYSTPLNAAALWHTLEALTEVNRPETEGAWKQFSSSRRIAWKTGTSFGFRDGWAIGLTPEYTVGVWVGNASGEGRPGLTGIEAAAPLLFDVFSMLPPTSWFTEPGGELEKSWICRQSGHKATELCPDKQVQAIPPLGLQSPPCPYHQLVHLDASGQYRVNSQCESIARMQHQPWFVLPPVMEWFYKSRNAHYATLPPYKPGCEAHSQHSMQLIYPAKASKIVVPRELDGATGRTVFEVAHRQPGVTLYWHLDQHYLGSTTSPHQMALHPSDGPHLLVVTDELGERLEHRFEVLAGVR